MEQQEGHMPDYNENYEVDLAGLQISTPIEPFQPDPSSLPVVWNVQAHPAGPEITLHGTVEEVDAQLLLINPAYDEDWANANANTASTSPDFEFQITPNSAKDTIRCNAPRPCPLPNVSHSQRRRPPPRVRRRRRMEVQAFPSGRILDFTGTVETVYTKLLKLSPNYDNEDWDIEAPLEEIPTFYNDIDETNDEDENEATIINVETRQNPADRIRCNFFQPKGWGSPLGKGAEHLKKLKGHPHLHADPSVCAKNKTPKTLPSWRNIGDGANVIRNKCKDKVDYRISVQLYHADN
ncbi:hypothetical protein BDV12DRAFT_193242 [Aspergillus spectabilis]